MDLILAAAKDLELTPFLLSEVSKTEDRDLQTRLWLRGGFPRSYLAGNDDASLEWRLHFISAFLERDIPALGVRIPAETLRRLWRMSAHHHGQLFHPSHFADSLGVTHPTVRAHVDLLTHAFMLRTLEPFHVNLKKRLVKSPKLYVRDSGVLHALLRIESFDDLLGNPLYGASWEGFVIENVLAHLGSRWQAGFYQTAARAELDLVLEYGRHRIAIECKASSAPTVGKGFWSSLQDLEITQAWVVAQVSSAYPLKENVSVVPLGRLLADLDALTGSR